jgi:hypothetical protein
MKKVSQCVYLAKSGRHLVSICVDRKQIYLGTFDTHEEAEAVRIKAELEHRGKFTYGELRPIPGFEGYFATSDGQVLGRHGRPLAFHVDDDGYKRVSLAVGRGKDARRVHRGIHQAVCASFNGVCPEGMVARHLDGSKRNNTPDNLKWATILENAADREVHGTVPRGEKSGVAKLTDDDVYSIRCFLAVDFSQRELAALFAVSQSTVHLINKKATWSHVTRGSWQKS